jgi:hypothetical protein
MVVDGWVHTHDGNELVLGHDATGVVDQGTFMYSVTRRVASIIDVHHIGIRCRWCWRRWSWRVTTTEAGAKVLDERLSCRQCRDPVLEVVPFDSRFELEVVEVLACSGIAMLWYLAGFGKVRHVGLHRAGDDGYSTSTRQSSPMQRDRWQRGRGAGGMCSTERGKESE